MRRFHLVLLAVGFLRLLASGALAQPNFVVVFTDDQTYRAIGYQSPVVKTPALDRLAADGVIFTHAYVASPICAASRASILTGLFPQQHGCISLGNKEFRRDFRLGKPRTLASYLSAAGYVTGFCGKSHLGDPRGYGFQYGKAHEDIYDEEAFAFAAEFLGERARDKRPFLLWIAPRQPHLPLLPAAKWLDLYPDAKLKVEPNFRRAPPEGSLYNQGVPGELYYRDSRYRNNYKGVSGGPPRSEEEIRHFTKAYYATISHLDHQVGELVSRLRADGLEDDTAIIFLSDNGYFLGNHGLGNKITMHEESVRVPMFIRCPRAKMRGVRSAELVSSLDVMPTILELAGVEPPQHLTGKSLVPLLGNPQHHLREFVASECAGISRRGGGKPGTGHRMVRTKRWKYILTGVNEEALFDQERDIYELSDVAGSAEHRETLTAMRKRMRSWMEAVGDTHAPPPEDSAVR